MAEAVRERRRTHDGEKRLNEMDRLGDMLHFPVLVNAGATLNVLITIVITWWVQARFPGAATPLLWIALVLFLNLLPVVVLRRTITPATVYPTLRAMNFVRDQHKFSDWVYLAASANMAFWILLAWTVAGYGRTTGHFAVLITIAFLATFAPVLPRPLWRVA